MMSDLSTAITLNNIKAQQYDRLYTWVYRLNLSDGAIILYTMARNNFELSRQNEWVDDSGRIYFYLTRQAVMEKRNGWSLAKISRLLKELCDKKLLIDIKERGGATRFYLEGDLDKIFNNSQNSNKVGTKQDQSQNDTSHKTSLGWSQNESTTSHKTSLGWSQNESLIKQYNQTKLNKTISNKRIRACEKNRPPNLLQDDGPNPKGEILNPDDEILTPEVIEPLNADSFSLKKEMGYENLSSDYKDKLKEYITEQLHTKPSFMSYENFINCLLTKNYKYKNFARAYLKWNSSETKTDNGKATFSNPYGFSDTTLNAMHEFLNEDGEK